MYIIASGSNAAREKNVNIELLISNKLNICLKGKSQTEGPV